MPAPYPQLDRQRLLIKPLAQRVSKADASVLRFAKDLPPEITQADRDRLQVIAQKMLAAKARGGANLLTYGAHLFRNGMSPLIIDMMKRGLIDQLTTNGAGGIHDWELAFHGRTTEDVGRYLDEGQVGIWEETGLYQNLALALGAAEGLGYGQSLGKMMAEERLVVPSLDELKSQIGQAMGGQGAHLAAKAALFEVITGLGLKPGVIELPHPGREHSLLYQAYQLGIPLSICPGIGYDIIYSHPANHGGSLGQAATSDFLTFADSVGRLEGGVYLSVGSAVMSPMILEKALSMARNLAIQEDRPLNDFHLAVVDMQPGTWDWKKDGEPPNKHPAYYLRFCKSFSRMGGDFEYYEMDNRAFFQNLFEQVTLAQLGQGSP